MKRYRLLKDLPTIKAGEEFYMNEAGDLVSADEDEWVVFSRTTLDEFPNILEDWFGEIQDGYKRIYFDTNGFKYATGIYFKIKEEAQDYKEYLIALQTLKDDAKGFKPDWGNGGEKKYHVYYSYTSKQFEISYKNVNQLINGIYFRTEANAGESIKNHRKEWEIVRDYGTN